MIFAFCRLSLDLRLPEVCEAKLASGNDVRDSTRELQMSNLSEVTLGYIFVIVKKSVADSLLFCFYGKRDFKKSKMY